VSRSPLLGHPLLRGVDERALDGALDRITIKAAKRGVMLSGPGVGRGRLYLVLKGCLRAYKVTADGRELLLALLPEGEFDGLISMSGGRGHFTEAYTDATVAALELRTLEELISREPKIAANLLQMDVERLERRESQLETVTLNDPARRLARQMLALGDSVGRRDGDWVLLDPRITHQMLADMLGVRRETVTLHLRQLTQMGAVATDRRRFRLNTDKLREIVRGRRQRTDAA
jgi:CRP-like cAMP-binding protein